jgi:hypothetical protein
MFHFQAGTLELTLSIDWNLMNFLSLCCMKDLGYPNPHHWKEKAEQIYTCKI